MANNKNNDSFEEFEKDEDIDESNNSEKPKADELEDEIDDKELGEAPIPKGKGNDKLHIVKGTQAEDGVRNVTQLMTEDAKKIKKKLSTQPKTNFYIPLTTGEKLGQAYETVTINGYRLEIKKGMMVEVPQQVADMLTSYLNIQTSVGIDMRVENKSDDVQKALS